jgi:predicted GNAT family acetyltransferase
MSTIRLSLRSRSLNSRSTSSTHSRKKRTISMVLPMASHPSVAHQIDSAFFAKTLSNVSKQASLLAGFRQYVQYHCQASKCNLHTRVINRIEQFYKVPEVLSQSIVLSKFEESTLEYSSSAM